MKALNRAIARTVSQLGRYGREGCHPPMLFALEKHLDALLALELKQAETAGMKFATLTGDGTGEALRTMGWTPGKLAVFNSLEPEHWHAPSLITGGRLPGKSGVDKLLRTPVEKWTSDQLAWFKANVLLSVAEREKLEARWEAANTQAKTAPVEGTSKPHDKPVQWYQSGVHGIGDPGLQWTPSAASEQPVPTPPAPDVIDMTNPANWQEGDVLLRTGADWANFENGNEYLVMKVDHSREQLYVGNHEMPWTGYTFDLLKGEDLFQWLRHGEAQQ